ncbi:MAG: hypothetical protein ABI346_00150, partial [Candidatus Baltobacteraceae bacterium]
TGSPYSIKLARELIDKLDVAQKLVVLDTEVLEIDETESRNLGLSLPQPIIASTFSEVVPIADQNGNTPRLLRLQPLQRTGLSLAAQLNLLIQHGNGRVLADPRITTVSGRTATIRAGDTIAIETTTGGGAGTIATTQLQTFQTGVTLDITPIVNADDFISVTLHPVVNSNTGFNNGIPQISTRDTQTTVALREGQTLIIGGLIQDAITKSTSKIPILGDLPLLGHIFRATDYERQRNELVITVTPHIVVPGEAAPFPNAPLPGIPTAAPLPTLAPGTTLPQARTSSPEAKSGALEPPPPPLPVLAGPEAPAPPTPGATMNATPSAEPNASVNPSALPSSSPHPSANASSNPNAQGSQAPVALPSAFAQTNTFTYGQAPQNNFAGPNDSVQIFYATFTPTVVRAGTTVTLAALTTSNVAKLTLGYGGFSTQIAQGGPGKWLASFALSAMGLPPAPAGVSLTLVASRLDGASTSIAIPVSVAP